ncbi:MAG: hypothetical protein SFY56_04045 [Bacteroidota bacterium]|nr:hypothetical protein [Bacteroidota bacterium]
MKSKIEEYFKETIVNIHTSTFCYFFLQEANQNSISEVFFDLSSANFIHKALKNLYTLNKLFESATNFESFLISNNIDKEAIKAVLHLKYEKGMGRPMEADYRSIEFPFKIKIEVEHNNEKTSFTYDTWISGSTI